MNKIILFCCLLISSLVFAQEISINGKSYPATQVWDFICEYYAYSGVIQVQIAKTEQGGLLKIMTDTNNSSHTIAGNIYIDLNDMSAIICTDKNRHQTNGSQIISYYSLTTAEMNRLKNSEMRSIRFAIKGKSDAFSSQTGHFTAINKIKYFATSQDNTQKGYPTAAAILELYKK